MKCKDTERLIPTFLSEKLNNKELKSFLLHVENCPDCMEELSIQYLVMIGAAMLEEGNSVDLHKELEKLLENAWHKINKHRILIFFSYFVEVLAIIAMMIILIMVVF